MERNENGAFFLSEEERGKITQREETFLHTVATEKRHELLFAPYHISFSVFRTISYLMVHPDGAAPSRIADDLLILRQTMTNIVDGLEKRGLAERAADPGDRRRIRIRLLPAGWELGLQLLREENEFGDRIFRRLTPEERAEYYRLEKKLYEAKEAALKEILGERE